MSQLFPLSLITPPTTARSWNLTRSWKLTRGPSEMEASVFIKKEDMYIWICTNTHTHARTRARTHTHTHTHTEQGLPQLSYEGEREAASFLPYLGPHLTPELHRRQLHPISINRFMRTNCTRYVVPNTVRQSPLQWIFQKIDLLKDKLICSMEYTFCSKKQTTDTASVNQNTQACQCLKQVCKLWSPKGRDGVWHSLKPPAQPGAGVWQAEAKQEWWKERKKEGGGENMAPLPLLLLLFKSLTSEAAGRSTT